MTDFVVQMNSNANKWFETKFSHLQNKDEIMNTHVCLLYVRKALGRSETIEMPTRNWNRYYKDLCKLFPEILYVSIRNNCSWLVLYLISIIRTVISMNILKSLKTFTFQFQKNKSWIHCIRVVYSLWLICPNKCSLSKTVDLW